MNIKGLFSTLSRSWLTAIAIAFGVLVLAGYFFNTLILTSLRVFLLSLAVILAAFALLVGVANLFAVHIKKIRRKEKGSPYSIILIVSMLFTFLAGLLSHSFSAINSFFDGLFNYVQLPVEASLMGLLAITLTYAAIRLLRRRFNLLSIIFLLTALLTIFGTVSLPLLGEVPGLSGIVRPVLSEVFATSGARGILLGVGLGTLITGLRILLGADRPYGGK